MLVVIVDREGDIRIPTRRQRSRLRHCWTIPMVLYLNEEAVYQVMLTLVKRLVSNGFILS